MNRDYRDWSEVWNDIRPPLNAWMDDFKFFALLLSLLACVGLAVGGFVVLLWAIKMVWLWV